MTLTFRQRIFAWLVTIAIVPATIAILYAVLGPRYEVPPGGARAWEEAAATFREVRARTNRAALSPGMRLALDRHAEQLNTSVRHARQAEAISVAFSGILAGTAIALALLVLGGAVRLAGHLARQMSRPIDELVAWTTKIRKGEPIPDAPPAKGAPEFGVLRESLRTMAGELARARANEVEAAELRAFRDMAKNVAHELKNPLTPIRFAVERLAKDAPPEHRELLAVLESESDRLEKMARDFAELGRLPQGPAAPVDLGELLDELARGAPEDVAVRVAKEPGTPLVSGHYEPLRRALHNLVINAIDAVHEKTREKGAAPATGEVVLGVRALANGDTPSVEVTVRDSGAGVRPGDIARVFEPHFTTKAGGTGLGLAIVRQTVRYHGGTIAIASEPGHGTVVTVVLPTVSPTVTT
ncbi:MAG: sensor histidine kinase [Gemmatimonadales bacterium]